MLCGVTGGLTCERVGEKLGRIGKFEIMTEKRLSNKWILRWTWAGVRYLLLPGHVTHHMACTETGLNTCTLLSVDTLKPLRRGEKVQIKNRCSGSSSQTATVSVLKYVSYPSPSRCINVSLHKGKTSPTEHELAGRKQWTLCLTTSCTVWKQAGT